MKKKILYIIIGLLLMLVCTSVSAVQNNYQFKDDKLIGLDFKTILSVFEGNFKEDNDGVYELLSCQSNMYIGTGCRFSYDEKEYETIVHGDVSGDGLSTMTDIVKMAFHIDESKQLTNSYLFAGDINGDSKINNKDLYSASLYVVKNKNFDVYVENSIDVESINVSNEEITIKQNEGYKISYEVLPEGAINNEIIFESSDSNIASVNSTGYVIARKPGEAIITLSYKNSDGSIVKKELKIKVIVPVTGITIQESDIRLVKGDTGKIELAISPVDATYEKIRYTSKDTNIVEVSDDGIVTAVGVGETVVTIEVDGYSVECTIQVIEKLVSTEEIEITNNDTTIYTGQTLQLEAVISPDNATNKSMTWSSSDNNIATITRDGLLTAKSKGTVTVSVKDNSYHQDSIEITVLEDKLIANVNEGETEKVNNGGTFDLKVTRLSNGNDVYKDVVYTSSDTSVLTVTSDGLVKGVSTGKTTVTIKSKDGLLSTKVSFEVLAPVTKVIFDCTGLELIYGGDPLYLKATVNSSETISWASKTPNIAGVTADGELYFVSPGTAIIVASASGASAQCEIPVKEEGTVNITATYSTTASVVVSYKLVANVNGVIPEYNYQWYLDNKAIDGATSSTYTAKNPGTYKVNVFRGGKVIVTDSYTIDSPNVAYEHFISDTAKWAFVNNPEELKHEYRADTNNKVLYTTTFKDRIELYFEHNRGPFSSYYYAIRVHNPNSTSVDLTIFNSGGSRCQAKEGVTGTCLYYADTWKKYYTDNITTKDSYTIPAGGYLYFYLTNDEADNAKFVTYANNVPTEDSLLTSWAIDGVINMGATKELEVANVVFLEYSSKVDEANIPVRDTRGQVTGIYNGLPMVRNELNFEVTDETKAGNLPVAYDATGDDNADPTLFDRWKTNISGSPDTTTTSVQRDFIPIYQYYNKDNKVWLYNHNTEEFAETVLTPTTIKPFSSDFVLANWAVHYVENITIKNTSSKERKVAFVVNSAAGTETSPSARAISAFVTDETNSKIISNDYTYYDSNSKANITVKPTVTFKVIDLKSNIKVWEATLKPGEEVGVSSIVILGGMSYGNLEKMICVDGVCRNDWSGEYEEV